MGDIYKCHKGNSDRSTHKHKANLKNEKIIEKKNA